MKPGRIQRQSQNTVFLTGTAAAITTINWLGDHPIHSRRLASVTMFLSSISSSFRGRNEQRRSPKKKTPPHKKFVFHDLETGVISQVLVIPETMAKLNLQPGEALHGNRAWIWTLTRLAQKVGPEWRLCAPRPRQLIPPACCAKSGSSAITA